MPYLYRPKKEREYISDKRKEGHKFYHDIRWRNLRDWYITNHPLCEMCMIEGKTKEAKHVHHRIPWERGKTEEEKYDLLLNPDNLMSLCVFHHQQIHKSMH